MSVAVPEREISKSSDLPTTKTMNSGIHYARGLAAFIVLVHHASAYLMILRNYGEIHTYIPLFGRYGVEIFFAISGYLMASIMPKQNAFDFLTRRILRIYPIFLIATAIALYQPFWHRPLNLPSLMLSPIGKLSASALGVEWTLVLEVGFYVMLFIVILVGLKRYIQFLAGAWLAVLLWYAFTHDEFGPQSTTIVNFLLAPANIAFAIGLLLPTILTYRNAAPALLSAGLVVLVIAHLSPISIVRTTVAISSACLVGWATTLQKLTKVIDWPLQKLGDWSYSLYLCHVPVIIICYKALPSAGVSTLFLIGILAPLAATCILGPVETRLHMIGQLTAKRLPRTTKVILTSCFALAYLGIGIYYL